MKVEALHGEINFVLQLLYKAVVMGVSHLSHTKAQCEELKGSSYARRDSAGRDRGLLARKEGPLLLFIFLKVIANLVTGKMSPIAITFSFCFLLPCPRYWLSNNGSAPLHSLGAVHALPGLVGMNVKVN